MKKTKVVCTIGPASESEETLRKMFKAGCNVCRLNFSHGSHEEHQIKIDRIKKLRTEMNLPIAIMLDTKGPEIRLKTFANGPVDLKQNQLFTLTTRDIIGDETICSITYANLPAELTAGDRILIDDGLVEMNVLKIKNGTDIICTVINDGEISNHKGLNMPGVKVRLPFLSEKDISDIRFGVKNRVDFIAASFTRTADDVLEIRRVLEEENGNGINIIAKIENQEGLDNIDKILEVADGIMVARGDLGIEIPPEQIPLAQKRLIQKANIAGKPVITATQMLESMTRNLRPTRAEVTDIANAILDGTSAIMLSGETAAGQYPVQAVKMMYSIAETTEASLDYEKLLLNSFSKHALTTTNAIARATCSTALDLEAHAIIAATSSGDTARAISKFKPKAPIIAVTYSEEVMQRLSLNWGVYPLLTEKFTSTDELFESCIKKAKDAGFLTDGDLAILTAGIPIGLAGSTNILKIETVGKILLKGKGAGLKKIITGRVCIAKDSKQLLADFKDGDIIVAKETTDEINLVIDRASAIITENGNLAGHAAIMGMLLAKPTVIDAKNACDILTNGEIITLNGSTGVVLKGIAKMY
ncbi:pyruvate kinase [Treponema phagedenis]|uniref:Pyruvate kinase n=1 Tax=Treponema phagedenis TaxID=162 RepID=A0A0B7GX22_TREPH|nr:pyruvate kinase [Treponema phagedenis]NVP23649.1 pyruvate kinase [Treponema phagedenis]QKS91835.1 pyruvate kinase [Treponema phagedenis]QLC58475.1 pyruvate kinase [Treponema phagedenis]QSI00720.1 pyruvate kinase [Treponema phagedenis]CEM63229.1 Pyruvate kinase [Treponema phagedenis]